MIIEVGLVVAAGAVVYEYVRNAKFKSAVNKDVSVVESEVVSLKTKAVSVVKVVEADFTKVEAAVKSLLSKL